MRDSINDIVAAYTARHAMEPVEAETHAHLIAHRILEGMDEPVCEFGHTVTTCTRSVTHRLVSCEGPANICQGARAFADEVLTDPTMRCQKCFRALGECWRMWAI